MVQIIAAGVLAGLPMTGLRAAGFLTTGLRAAGFLTPSFLTPSFLTPSFLTTGLLTTGLLALCGWIAVVDLRDRRIPDLASLALLLAGLALSGLASGLPLADRLIGAGAGFLLLWALGEVWFRQRGVEALGIGDAKLFGAAGAWLGWQALPEVLLIAALMGLTFAALRAALRLGPRQADIAFGPWLAAGLLLGWLRLLAGL